MTKYLITFSYDGTNFNGYQRQPGLRTVQGEIEKALKFINNKTAVELVAASRTDAKVHALNQKAHFELSINVSNEKLKMALNTHIGPDIYIKDVNVVDNDFHARYKVKYKEYNYIINMGEYNPLERNYVYQYNKSLNLREIQRALKFLEGEHDFFAFAYKEDKDENTIRNLINTDLVIDKNNPNKIILTFLGTGFLRYQVRNMVGTLLEVGEGKRKSEDIIELLNRKDRKKACKPAGPEGLYLNNVTY